MSKSLKKVVIIILSIIILILIIVLVNLVNKINVLKSISKIMNNTTSNWDKYIENADKLIVEPLGINKYSGPWIKAQNEFENDIKKMENNIYNKGYNKKIITKLNELFVIWNTTKPIMIDLNNLIIKQMISSSFMENIEVSNASFEDIYKFDWKGQAYSSIDSFNVLQFIKNNTALKEYGKLIKIKINDLNDFFKSDIKILNFFVIIIISIIIISLITIFILITSSLFKKEKDFFE